MAPFIKDQVKLVEECLLVMQHLPFTILKLYPSVADVCLNGP